MVVVKVPIERDRLGERIDALFGGAAQGDEGMKVKGILVGSGAEADVEPRGAEGAEGVGRDEPRARQLEHHAASVPEASRRAHPQDF
jgi:hypothetical protein